MKVKIEINCDNASLNDESESVSDVLSKLVEKIKDEPIEILQNEIVRDVNGNTILWMSVERD